LGHESSIADEPGVAIFGPESQSMQIDNDSARNDH
jgi:hypothetical protein